MALATLVTTQRINTVSLNARGVSLEGKPRAFLLHCL